MKLYTQAEAAKKFSLSRRSLIRYEADGLIEPVRTPGGQRRYPESELLRLYGLKEIVIELPEEEVAPETVNPYVCPCCGGDYITGHSIEAGEGRADQEMTCETCGAWWHDIYVLDRQEIFED